MENLAATVADLFTSAIALENAAEALYRQLAEMFAGHPEVAAFWKHYADEEKGHGAYLARIRDGVPERRLAAPADANMMRNARKCLHDISQAPIGHIANLEQAYQLAVELENSETNTIFEFVIVNFSTDELAKSHKFLRAQLHNHIAKLEEAFPQGYRDSFRRREVLVKSEK
ncbi:MAG: ferritin family protein [Chloroflexota bacterium]